MRQTGTPRIPLAIVSVSFFLWIATAIGAGGSGEAPNHLKSFLRARAVFERTYRAERAGCFSQFRTVVLSEQGRIHNPRQAYSLNGVDGPESRETYLGHFVFDFESERSRSYTRARYHGGHDLRFEQLFVDGKSYQITTQMRRYVGSDGDFEGNLDPLLHLPGYALFAMEDQLGSITWVGESDLAGRAVDVVEIDWVSAPRRRLYVQKNSGELLALGWLATDPIWGERETKFRYEGRRDVDGCRVPDRVDTEVNGEVWTARTIDRFVANAELPESVFELDSDLQPFDGSPGESHLTDVRGPVREIHGLGGFLYRVPFVEFEDFVVVYDAVLSAPTAVGVIEKIAAATDGKPIRYVVLSHNHTDHLRGLRPFVEAGAAVITSAATEPRIEQFLAATGSRLRSLESESPEEVTPDVIVVTESDPLVIKSGAIEVEVINLGATPHVDGLLVLVVRPSEVVIQADSYFTFSPFAEQFGYLIDWVAGLDLEDALITGVHHGPIDLESLESRRDDKTGFVPRYLEAMSLPGE